LGLFRRCKAIKGCCPCIISLVATPKPTPSPPIPPTTKCYLAFGTNGTKIIIEAIEGQETNVVAIAMLVLDVAIMLPISEITPFALTIGRKYSPYKNVFEWMITTQE
jgi:hypothetical protein